MSIINTLSKAKNDLQKSVKDLEKIREDLFDQLHTTYGQFDEEEVYNYHNPHLKNSTLDELEETVGSINETMNDLEDDLPTRINDMFDTNVLDELDGLYGNNNGELRELSTFDPSKIEEDYITGAHNEELDIAAQKAADAIAEVIQELAEKAEEAASSMFENIDKLSESIKDIINEL